VVVFDGDDRACRVGRVDQGLVVDRLDRIEVDDASRHSLGGQLVGGGERFAKRDSRGDNRDLDSDTTRCLSKRLNRTAICLAIGDLLSVSVLSRSKAMTDLFIVCRLRAERR
jgi:hypothetical protein